MKVRSVLAPKDKGVFSEASKQLEECGLWAGWEYFYLDKNGREITEEAAEELRSAGCELREAA